MPVQYKSVFFYKLSSTEMQWVLCWHMELFWNYSLNSMEASESNRQTNKQTPTETQPLRSSQDKHIH